MASVNTAAYTRRFSTQFKSVNGRNWLVQIWDRNYNGTPDLSFDITDGGLTLKFDSDGDEKFAPIVGSKCSLNFMVNYAQAGHANFIDNLLGFGPSYQEGDLFIKVTVPGTSQVIFCGEYLMDLDTLPDTAGPFPIQLVFTDGIGKLKEISFLAENVDTTVGEYSNMGHLQFSYWIGQVMQHTKFYVNAANPNGFWNDATDAQAFSTCVRWWNTDMYYTPNSSSKYADPLQQTSATMQWTDKYNPANQQRNVVNAYDVLKAICKSWGMRVICSNGNWWFYQIFEYENRNLTSGTFGQQWNNPVDMDRYNYYADGNIIEQKTSMGNKDWNRFNNYIENVTTPGGRIQKLSGGKYKFLPVLKEVKVNLIHEGANNVFPGFGYPNAGAGDFRQLQGGPYVDSTSFNFKTDLWITMTAPAGQYLTTYEVSEFEYWIIAVPAGSSDVTEGLATLNYDSAADTYSWVTGFTYIDGVTPSSVRYGPQILQTSMNGPFPGGQTSTIKLGPSISFPGYRNDPTDYLIGVNSPVFVTNSLGTWINTQTGYPYNAGGSTAYVFGTPYPYSDPIDTSALAPPSWSTGTFNSFLSTIQPIAQQSDTMNTIFINTQTEDSHKLDWGDVFWGDGPEHWASSALRVQTGLTTWEFSDWTSKNWLRTDQYTAGTPPAGTGLYFTQYLAYQMKQCQSVILKRANFKTVNSPEQPSLSGHPFFVNAMGALQDCYEKSNGQDAKTQYFFRRGTFDLINNQWSGEWIETAHATPSGSIQSIIGGPTNLTGTGGTMGALLNTGPPPSSTPRLTLLRATENVVLDVAITSLAVQLNRGTDIDANTDFVLGVDYNLKSGDEVWLCYTNGIKYALTLTADVTPESALSISFTSITPEFSSPSPPLIQIPMLKVWENMNRKTSGSIGEFVVDGTSFTKGGISIDGFLDSDTMTGASATTIPTSESVKAYVDASDGLSNYSMLTCSTTSLGSATDGEANAVVIKFDTELASATNTIDMTGSAGVGGVSDSDYAWNIGGTPPIGYFEMSWNIASTLGVHTNRLLSGVKLQQGVVTGAAMVWTDVNGTHGFIYDRGTTAIRKGSVAASAVVNLSGSVALYYRLVLWKEAGTSGTAQALTEINGCQITIKEF